MATTDTNADTTATNADTSLWRKTARDIACRSPVDGLAQFDAAFDQAIAVGDVAVQLALSANAMGFMLFHWTRFDRWREWVDRFEAAHALLPDGADGAPELTRLSGALAAALLRGDTMATLAPLGHRLELLVQLDADPIQLYLATATVLPWLQLSRNAAAAQALYARMLALADAAHAEHAATNADDERYLGGAWLCAWAQYLLNSDHSRFAEALCVVDAFMRTAPVPLLQFRHARLTTEKHILAQDTPLAERALASMLTALHPNRPMERVIYNSVATLVLGRSGDAERMRLHGSHIARDLVTADCPPALATVFHMAEARAHLVTRCYALAVASYEHCARDAHRAHADIYLGLSALAQVMLFDRDDPLTLGTLRERLGAGLAAMRKEGRGNFFAVAEHARATCCALALRETIEVDFVRAAIARFPTSPPDWADEHWPWVISLRSFGGFRAVGLLDEGRVANKASNRPLSLLKLIVAYGKQGITVAHAADALWPAQDGDQAENSLSVTLLRLRKMNASADLIVRSDGWLHLDLSKVWTDVTALETHLEKNAKALSEVGLLDYIKRLFDLYRGDCLFGIEDDWAHGRAAHYRGRVTLATQQLLQSALEGKHTDAAALLITQAHARGLDVARLLNAVHPGQRATPAWMQLQQHLSLVGIT